MTDLNGYCHCGCGQKTRLAPQTCSTKGWKRGQPIRFVKHHVNRVENERRDSERTELKCTKCKQILPASQFEFRNDTKTYRGVCRKCRVSARYGISSSVVAKLIERQKNKCPICLIDFSALSRTPVIDHNHLTGTVRGVLCDTCNRAIGMLKDDAHCMRRAMHYLETEFNEEG